MKNGCLKASAWQTIAIKKTLSPLLKEITCFCVRTARLSMSLPPFPFLAEGDWELNNNELIFTYKIPKDTVRTYNISLTRSTLLLEENGMQFAFIAAERTTVKHSAFSITALSEACWELPL